MSSNKSFPPISTLPLEDEWVVSEAEHLGKPMFVRVGSSAKSYAGHPELPVRLGVAVPLLAADEHGLPGATETGTLDAIEELLFDAIQSSGVGRIVLVITTSGMREFVAYVRSKEASEAAVSRARAAAKTHKLQHYTAPDPQWKLFGQFA